MTSRRRVLALLGVPGAITLAGCSSGAPDDTVELASDDESDGNETGGEPTTAGADCDGFDGSPTAFDPGAAPWIFTFEYPDTWRPWAAAIDDDSSGAVSADIGHVATSTDDEYRVNLRVDQVTTPRDREFVDEWIESGNFAITEALEYDGEPLDVATGHVTPEDTVYRVALPAPAGAPGTFQQVSLRAWMLEEYVGCSEAIFDTAWQVLASMQPIPERTE